MAKTGVVTQTAGGMVYECTLSRQCKESHQGLPAKKNCLLSVDHGDRCQAWDTQRWVWLIDEDPSKIKQL